MLYNFNIFAWTTVTTIITVIYFLVIAIAVVAVIHDRRDPVKTLAWVLVITMIPVAGIVLYIAVGRNHRKEKLFNRKELYDLEHLDRICHEQLQELHDPAEIKNSVIEHNRDFVTLILNNNRSPLTVHNRVKIFNNGVDTFRELFGAIANAQSSIHLEYYIIEPDQIGHQLYELLARKAAEGVEVRVIYDDVGSWSMKYKLVKKLRHKGIDAKPFMPVVFPWLTSKVNYRNHRKVAVIDGRVAFTGGINIADRYVRGNRMGAWRDTHLRIEGESVAVLQALFVTDWYFVSGKESLTDSKYYPRSRIRTETPIQIASSGPDSDWASIMQSFFAAICKARKSIYVTTPYFLPNQAILTAMRVAALRGVDVKIILPHRSDSKLVYWASMSYVSDLLEAGVEVYLYDAGFNHSKVIIIDNEISSVGSANLDIRSFEDNFEVTALLYDVHIADELTRYFEEDLAASSRVTREQWDKRSNLHAAYESVARMFSPLL